MDKSEDEAEVGLLPVKLPAFWPDKPEAWFEQAETNFRESIYQPKDEVQLGLSRSGRGDARRVVGSHRKTARWRFVRQIGGEVGAIG